MNVGSSEEDRRTEKGLCINSPESSVRGLLSFALASNVGLQQRREKQTSIIDLSTTRIHSLQKLIHFVIAHFLAQIRQD